MLLRPAWLVFGIKDLKVKCADLVSVMANQKLGLGQHGQRTIFSKTAVCCRRQDGVGPTYNNKKVPVSCSTPGGQTGNFYDF